MSENNNIAMNVGGDMSQPISVLGYIWYFFILAIPILGLVLAIKWAFTGINKINPKITSIAPPTITTQAITFIINPSSWNISPPTIVTAMDDVLLIAEIKDIFANGIVIAIR